MPCETRGVLCTGATGFALLHISISDCSYRRGHRQVADDAVAGASAGEVVRRPQTIPRKMWVELELELGLGLDCLKGVSATHCHLPSKGEGSVPCVASVP